MPLEPSRNQKAQSELVLSILIELLPTPATASQEPRGPQGSGDDQTESRFPWTGGNPLVSSSTHSHFVMCAFLVEVWGMHILGAKMRRTQSCNPQANPRHFLVATQQVCPVTCVVANNQADPSHAHQKEKSPFRNPRLKRSCRGLRAFHVDPRLI